MKVLLVGEYSGVHTNLANALREKGVFVKTLSDGDSYKKFDSDYRITYNELISKNKILKYFFFIYYAFLDFSGLKGVIQIWKYNQVISELKGYDVVQIINPVALSGFGSLVNLFFIKHIKKNNKKLFLCALGDDYFWVKSQLNDKNSMFGLMKLNNFYKFLYSLKYVYGFFYPKLNKKVVEWCDNIIPGLYDYYKVYEKNPKCVNIIPIIIDEVNPTPYKFDGYPIKIFHGWQLGKELRKGNLFFDEAINKLPEKYKKKIEYKVVKNLPYNEYIFKFKESTIFFDQCLSFDMGVNALLGMREGKVVFSGNKNGPNTFCDCVIESKPDVDFIIEKLIKLLDNPNDLERISRESVEYIASRHSKDVVIKQYMSIWKNEDS
jgi:hypothetical protein